MKPPPLNSISFKLLIPLVLCGTAIIGLISTVTFFEADKTKRRHIQQQAIQFSESFLMATEVNSSRSSIIRTTNSLGTYKGIKELFIIEEESERIIASNQNRYSDAPITTLPALYRESGWEQALREGNNFFIEAHADHYIYAYRARILSEDKKQTVSIVILMLLTTEEIGAFLDEFRNTIMFSSAAAFLGALFIFYLILRLTLLKRIRNIVSVIGANSTDGEPRLCPVENEDELGILVMAYNDALLSDHEHKVQLIAANTNLSKLSYLDSLTGVSNRRNFDRVLVDEWKRAARHQQSITLVMIDVDHFKRFNDQYGHVAGDNCLKAVAATLKHQLKRPGDLLCRYGGEEFSMILPNTSEHGNILAESCRKAVEKLAVEVAPNKPPVHVTVSIGLAHAVPEPNSSPDELMRLADKALYKAKLAGRNQVISLDALKPEAA